MDLAKKIAEYSQIPDYTPAQLKTMRDLVAQLSRKETTYTQIECYFEDFPNDYKLIFGDRKPYVVIKQIRTMRKTK